MNTMQHNFSANFYTLGRLFAVACLTLVSLPAHGQAQEAVWFVVAERADTPSPSGDSFLLPLSDPADIARARRLVDEGPGDVAYTEASIARGGDGFNRDVLAEDDLAWSWRVTEFRGFHEASFSLCHSASPEALELGRAFFFNDCATVYFSDFVPVAELKDPPSFFISEALNGAWYYPPTSGQGITVDVLAERGEVFLTWITYKNGGPAGLPAGEQAWISAQGTFAGNQATLNAYVSTDGAFDAPVPVTTQPIGQIELEFTNCNHGVLSYTFNDGSSGQFPIRRITSKPGCVSRLDDIRRRDDLG